MKTTNIKNFFQVTDWQKKWAVSDYSIISTSFKSLGYQRYSSLIKRSLNYNVYIFNKNTITCFQSNKENINFGKFIDGKIRKNKKFARILAKQTLEKFKVLKNLSLKSKQWLLNTDNFEQFSELYFDFMPFFVAISRCGNTLLDKKYKNSLKVIQKTRIKTENILLDLNDFILKSIKYISKKKKYNFSDLKFITFSEFHRYIVDKVLPDKKKLADRNKNGTALCFIAGKEFFLRPKETHNFLRQWQNKNTQFTSMLKGTSAFQGNVKGIARIVLDPKKYKLFNKGDILVSGSTRPEFLSLMYKASAFVTDVGGILSHAAITAREMQKPCIIGTQVATKILKDGDLVEVDANKGTVKILSKSKNGQRK